MTIRSSTEADKVAAEAKQMGEASSAIVAGLATVAGLVGLPTIAKVLAVKAVLIMVGTHGYALWVRYQAKHPPTAVV